MSNLSLDVYGIYKYRKLGRFQLFVTQNQSMDYANAGDSQSRKELTNHALIKFGLTWLATSNHNSLFQISLPKFEGNLVLEAR